MERNMNEYSELFYHCVQVLNEYNNNVSEEIFLKEYFKLNKVSNQSFILTVLIDCTRHSELVKTIVDIFYKINGINIRRSEQNIYKVLTYIIIFQLDSVGLKLLRGFIYSVQLYQVHQFLQFLVNEDYISIIETECLKLYDEEYVDEKILRIIEKYRPTLRGILLDLNNKMEGRTATRQLPELTKIKPFNLTASKERIIPMPKIIPKMEKCRPPPKSTYESSKEQNELEQIREQNHQQGLYKLNRTQSLSYHFMKTDKSNKTQIKQTKIIEENEKNLHFEQIRAHPSPKSQTNKIPVKFNVAAILKENQLFKKQEENVRQRLLDFEAGGKDAHEFFQWQEAMQKQDYEQEINAIERKRLEGKISYEEAILARQRLTDENRRIADEIKRQTREAIENHVKEKLKEEQRMKQLIEDVVNGRDNAKVAQQKLQQYKTDFVKQYKEEIKQLMKQALEEAEIEMRQRAELIKQIRTFELLPIDRWKPIDLTSVPGYGLHDEMSLVELHERLELIKFEREKERELRRDQIVKEKQIKEKMITNTIQNIAKYRNDLTAQAILKKQRNISEPVIVDKNNSELQQLKNHLETKRAQRLSSQQQRESVLSSGIFSKSYTSFKSSIEWNRFDQIMERLRRKFFKSKKPIKSTINDPRKKDDDDEIYLEPEYDETSNITSNFDAIADELLTIAKKSSHTIRLSKIRDDLLTIKTMITRKLTENTKELYNANKKIDLLKRRLHKQAIDIDHEGSLSTRYNRSLASDHSMADSASCYSIWSPTSSILSSSITTPTFRRRLAEVSVSNINYSSIIQEHFVYLYQQLCSNCSKCSCYQTFIRNHIELEYLSICSYNEQLKCENDLLQRLLADCKYSYEQQYVLFCQYEQYLIEYEQCIQIQYELIKTFQQLIDRFQIIFDKRKRDDDNHEIHIYQKINDVTNVGINQDVENAELYRMISILHEQCQRHLSQLPKRAQLFSYSQEQFHPPPNISGIVDIADLEISILLVDLLTLKHENSELRWTNNYLLREKKIYKTKIDLLELTNKYFRINNEDNLLIKNSNNELIQREKTLRLYVYRLYDLLQITSKQLQERQIYYENLIYQFKIRHRELIEYIRRIEQNKKHMK
ncbi:unnamed protein product [Rotaria sordida]|uniref:Uncharacterized protein n=2 Tax=Rotaria sordida TaxID=392033 RepID=A0A814JWX0_9BILA|nr:unnamed protein product [Rotaria sordida]